MKKKNELDILANAGENIVDSLASRPVLTKKEKERMYKMSRNKLDMMKENYTVSGAAEENAQDQVSGVERYTRRIMIGRVVAAAACAVLVIGVGTAALLSKKTGRSSEVINGPSEVIQPAAVTSVSIDSTATVTTHTSITTSGTAEVSGTSAENAATSADTGTSAQTQETTAASSSSSGDTAAYSSAAIERTAEFTSRYDTAHMNIGYDLTDINGDGVPELIIGCENNAANETYIFAYNGYEYVDISPEAWGFYGAAQICPEHGLIRSGGKNMYTRIFELDGAGNLNTLYDSSNGADSSVEASYSQYNWITPDYTFYAAHNGYIIDNAPQLYTDIDFDKLVEYGAIPDTNRTFCVGYDTKNLAASYPGADQYDGYEGGVAGAEYDMPSGTVTDLFPYFQGRKYRMRVTVLDRETELTHTLLVAELDFATGECKIIENYYPDAVDIHF